MIFATILAVVGGVLTGLYGQSPLWDALVAHKEYVLYALMFFVGISIGLHQGILAEIKRFHLKIFLIPGGIIVGSLLGGAVCSLLLGQDLRDGLAIAGGLGWYSLAGVSIANFAGIELGSIAFLANLLRELFAFLLIPGVARYCNPYTCIAPAAATSEDTTLPMLIQYTTPTIAVLAIFNGVICSAAVPILISLCYA